MRRSRLNYYLFILTIMMLAILLFIVGSFDHHTIPYLDGNEPPNTVMIKNSAIKWHCGIEWYEVKSIDSICTYINNFKQITSVDLGGRGSFVIADIYFNSEEDKMFHNSLRLSRSATGKDVFHLKETFYANDALVEFIIKELEIENFTSDECGH